MSYGRSVPVTDYRLTKAKEAATMAAKFNSAQIPSTLDAKKANMLLYPGGNQSLTGASVAANPSVATNAKTLEENRANMLLYPGGNKTLTGGSGTMKTMDQPVKVPVSQPSTQSTSRPASQPAAPSGNAAAPVDSNQANPSQPYASYDGMSTEQYRESLLASVRAGYMTEYEANASIIKNNLARTLSDLQSELSALEPLYNNQLQTIGQNQFATGEATKEIMNQGGWNASNSGLAIGEQTRIANAADKQRADALQAKTSAETDVNRRTTLANELAGNELASAEKIKNEKLAGAEAQATIEAENWGRQMYESDRSYDMQKKQFDESVRQADRSYNLQQKQFDESVRQFNVQLAEQRAARSAAQKAAAAKAELNTSEAEKSQLGNALLSKLYSAPNQQAAYTYMKKMMADESIPDTVKTKLLKDAQDFIKMINPDGTVYNPNQSSNDWMQGLLQ